MENETWFFSLFTTYNHGIPFLPILMVWYYFHVEFEKHHRLTNSDLEKDMKSTAKIMLPNLGLASIVLWDIKANTNSFLYFLNKNNLNYITKNSLHTVKYGLEAKHS